MLKCALAAGEGSMIQWDRLNAEIFREYLNSLRETGTRPLWKKKPGLMWRTHSHQTHAALPDTL